MITFMLLVVCAIFALLTLACSFYALEECSIGGIIGAVICGCLVHGTMNVGGDYNAVKDKAESYELVVEQRDDITIKYGQLKQKTHLLAKNYKDVQLAYGETSQELSGVYGKLEGVKGNLEKAQSDLVAVKAANEFCATDLQMSLVEKAELEDELRISQGQLETVRNLIRGN